jgi:hypothetical protein
LSRKTVLTVVYNKESLASRCQFQALHVANRCRISRPLQLAHSHCRIQETPTTSTTKMPSIVHLAPRLLEGSTTGGLSATAIGLIVGIGIIPVFILIWVVSWLFWCYPYNRSCCCTRRKKKQPEEEMADTPVTPVTSDETLREKALYNIPSNSRSSTTYRTESGGSSNNATRLTKADPRISMQTVGSGRSVQIMHEPRPFV